MFPLLIPMIGAAGGALMNKKDPLKGALLGAGAGAAGGLLAPAAAAGGATAGFGGAAGAGTQAGMLAAQEAGLGATSLGWGGATTGVQGGLNSVLGADMGAKAGGLLSGTEGASNLAPIIDKSTQAAPGSWSPGIFERIGAPGFMDKAKATMDTVDKATKPISTAMTVSKLVSPDPEQLPPPSVPQMPNFGGASQTLAQIAQQPQQMAMQQQQIDEAKKQRRMGLLSRMA